MCFEKEMEYLDSLAILLLALSLLGILFVLAIGIIFTRNLNTPVVKSSGELMVCFVILFCPFLHFAGTGFFIREPQSFTGKTRQTLFGMSFLLSASSTFWWSPWKFCWPSAVIPSCRTSWSAALNPSPSFSLARASWLSFASSSSSLQPLLWDRMSPCPESLSLNGRRGPFLHLAPCWAILPSQPSCASFVPSKAGNYLRITTRPNS